MKNEMTTGELFAQIENGRIEVGTTFKCSITGRLVKYDRYTGVDPDELLVDQLGLIDVVTGDLVEMKVTNERYSEVSA